MLLDAAVDSDGASAALQSRSRQAATVQLTNYVRNLEATTASAGARGLNTTTLQTELDEARRKLHGLMLATTEDKAKGDSSPDAAPAVPALPAAGGAAGS